MKRLIFVIVLFTSWKVHGQNSLFGAPQEVLSKVETINETYDVPDLLTSNPTPIVDMSKFYKEVTSKLKLNFVTGKRGQARVVYVIFLVEKSGRIRPIDAYPESMLSNRVTKKLKFLDDWNPGKVGNEPVNSVVVLPVNVVPK